MFVQSCTTMERGMLHYVNKKPDSDSVILSLEAARAFIRRYWDNYRAHDCIHGHECCSDRDGGPCMVDTLAAFPDAGRDDPT